MATNRNQIAFKLSMNWYQLHPYTLHPSLTDRPSKIESDYSFQSCAVAKRHIFPFPVHVIRFISWNVISKLFAVLIYLLVFVSNPSQSNRWHHRLLILMIEPHRFGVRHGCQITARESQDQNPQFRQQQEIVNIVVSQKTREQESCVTQHSTACLFQIIQQTH